MYKWSYMAHFWRRLKQYNKSAIKQRFSFKGQVLCAHGILLEYSVGKDFNSKQGTRQKIFPWLEEEFLGYAWIPSFSKALRMDFSFTNVPGREMETNFGPFSDSRSSIMRIQKAATEKERRRKQYLFHNWSWASGHWSFGFSVTKVYTRIQHQPFSIHNWHGVKLRWSFQMVHKLR